LRHAARASSMKSGLSTARLPTSPLFHRRLRPLGEKPSFVRVARATSGKIAWMEESKPDVRTVTLVIEADAYILDPSTKTEDCEVFLSQLGEAICNLFTTLKVTNTVRYLIVRKDDGDVRRPQS
jgi:hypothetical protein